VKMLIITVCAACAGILTGILYHGEMPDVFGPFAAVWLLTILLTIIGGVKAFVERVFCEKMFFYGFLTNLILGTIIAFLGLQLSVDLYIVVSIVLTLRIFRDASDIGKQLFSN
jgi:small basic protein